MRLQLTILILIIFSIKTFACSCRTKLDFKTKEDLNEYNFIAHIKITAIKKAENIDTDFKIHQMSFELLESYKGDILNTILVSGSHHSLKGWTSCDLGENVGDEWIIFGSDYQNGKLITGYCSRSKRIKSYTGYEDIKYPSQLNLKNKLQTLFDKVPKKIKFKGKRVKYYKNGNKQLEEHYSNGKIRGKRKLWYPNAVLQSKQKYKRGLANGTFEWYSSKGNLTKIEKFKNGFHTDTTTIWRKIDTSYLHLKIYSELNKLELNDAKNILSKRKIWIQRVYNDKGKMTSNVVYQLNGEKQNETIYFPMENKQTVLYYHKNGVLSSEMFRINYVNVGTYREWDENGKLTKSWEFDEKGNTKKETVKKH